MKDKKELIEDAVYDIGIIYDDDGLENERTAEVEKILNNIYREAYRQGVKDEEDNARAENRDYNTKMKMEADRRRMIDTENYFRATSVFDEKLIPY